MPDLPETTKRYARVIDASRRVRWEIDRDVVRGRRFDFTKCFLPPALSLADELGFLDAADKRLLSQVQGRTYANLFGLVERFIGAKLLEITRAHALGDQIVVEALVRFTDEELKHQELFRRIEQMIAADMPAGYAFMPAPNAVAGVVLGKSTWAVLALTCHIELFTLAHYRASIAPEHELCALWKDVFLFHWREESQHAILDELEWVREDNRLEPAQRDAAVDDLISLIGAIDGMLQAQAKADAAYFGTVRGAAADGDGAAQIAATVLKAYRWQYLVSGAVEPRFQKSLGSLTTPAQRQRIQDALAPLMDAAPRRPAA